MYSAVAEERSKLKFEDTNMANFGTELEYKLKKDVSEKEEAWKGTRDTVGLRIWRVEKFKIVDLDKKYYGKFYDGDSYIILNTIKKENSFVYNAFIWIGSYSSQDEYGTAAIKVVELDDYLDRKATLTREVQNYESEEFLALFKSKIEILNGGIESGFIKVQKIEDYPMKLYHIIRSDFVTRICEIPVRHSELNNDDCFVLDKVTEIYTFFGETCSSYERFKAASFVKQIKDERSTVKSQTFEINALTDLDREENKKFWEYLGGVPQKLNKSVLIMKNDTYFIPKLLKLSDESGELKMTNICENQIKKSMLDSNDIFLIDTESTLFVWIGKGASNNEKRNCFSYANKYLIETQRPQYLTLTVVNEGNENEIEVLKHLLL